MKTLNASDNTESPEEYLIFDDEGKQPCWYANVEKADTQKESEWTVGVVYPNGKKDEYCFKFSKIGRSKKAMEKAESQDFGVKLLETFKSGGQKAVDEWLKNGCP